jgi:hypothetical protein
VSLPEIWRRRGAVVLVSLGLAATLPPAAVCAATAVDLPSRDAVHAVAATLRADPALSGIEHTKTLRWKKDTTPQPKPEDNAWLQRLLEWIAQAMTTFAEAARWLIWLLGAVLVAVLLVTLRRWIQVGGDGAATGPLAAPTRVGTLDVRPESLPDRIGAAAQVLWLQGRHRSALSLLYRGALSRLIHGYAVPIRAAHTEAECLNLAHARLATEQRGFFGELVRVWQLAVYGARDPDDNRVLQLCKDFDCILDPPRAPRGAP